MSQICEKNNISMFQNSINQNQYFILLCLILRLHLAMVIMAFCTAYYIKIFLLEVGRCKLQVKCPMLQAAASVDGLIDWETFLELDPDRAVGAKVGKMPFIFYLWVGVFDPDSGPEQNGH